MKTAPAKPTINNWRKIVGQRIRRLSPEEARAMVARIQAEGATIFHADVRALTNGLNSQSINHYVIVKLAKRAGILPK
jgi:hypothetical protein